MSLFKFFKKLKKEKVSYDYEHILELVYSRLIEKGDLVIDIGAHSGRHTLPFADLVGQDGRVIAIEPNPEARNWLKDKVLSYVESGVVSILPFAVSNVNEQTVFTIADDRPEESGLRKREYNGPTTTSEVEVEVIQLDSLSENVTDTLKFIKLDVEGAEFNALLGAQAVLTAYKPIIGFEFGKASYEAYGVDPAALYKYLDDLGYRIYSILNDTLDKDSFVEASIVQTYWDYIACPREKAVLVENVLQEVNASVQS